MPSWLLTLGGVAAGRLPAVITLVLLGALGIWGVSSDWKLPALTSSRDRPAESETDSPIKVVPDSAHTDKTDSPSLHLTRLEFPSEEAVLKAGIRTDPANVRSMDRHVTAPGMIDYEPSSYSNLTARAPGTVWRVYKEVADPVRKDEVLALVDSAEVGKAKADFLSSLTQYQSRTDTLKRLRTATAAVSEQTLHNAETAQREARIRLFNDQQALLNLGLPIHIQDLESLPDDRRVRHMRLLGLPDGILKDLDAETLTANLLPMTAPFEGVVVRRNTAPGEVMQTNQPKIMFVVANVSQLHIDLDVNPADVAELRAGQPVFFRSEGEAATGEVEAILSRISPEVDEKTRRVRVHAEIDNRDGRLRPNSFGVGRIRVRRQPETVVVPNAAIQSDGRDHFIFVKLSHVLFEARRVRIGLRDAQFTEVDGVRPGELIVTAGGYALKSELPKFKERIAGADQ